MPIEIKEVSPVLDEPRKYRLENIGDREFLAIGRRGVIVRVETEPALGRDIGVIEFDTREVEVTRNDGTKMINAPFYTHPGDEIIIKRKRSPKTPKHYEIKHLEANGTAT